ncbi:CRISPR-associated helicase Cas3' [Paenibacillus protaetiae]|uniref:CRISPR-associated helicase Cas3 n=1 Tax=Paenibacillus protaetiae TaxID=2509456 RepID=A0A4P6F4L9_9BACL|nr:CRISPR-associated helicase Cas3' [Paenibacillus protaetiae]QAY65338.1 CRISPR-associated helicase Cas3' [Paenibacillus protaetiae]
MKDYIAHIRSSDGEIQTVEEHLLGVKQLAESYGEKLGVKHIAGLAGMLHDMGKYTNTFRTYILEAVKNPNNPPKRGSVDHSTAGGKLLYEKFHQGKFTQFHGVLAEIVGNAIISHHSYLHDFLSTDLETPYLNRMRKTEPELPQYEMSKQLFFEHVMPESEFLSYAGAAANELEAYLRKPSKESTGTRLMFLSKYIFSTLIDADRTNTRIFEEKAAAEPELDSARLFTVYYDRLMRRIESYSERADAISPINLLRREMSEQCDKFAERPSGIYSLSIPTGGGKTLASLRYALKHALSPSHPKKRIIYVVPFTTIIEQNAEEIRQILQDDVHILEHHSNVIDDDHDDDELEDGIINTRQKLKLAKDNWDSPIIFTTLVQFLNVFYAKGSRNIRKLHNLCESVIIFDEVQKVPVSCVSLFNHALNFLKTHGQSSIVLCTATQPELGIVEHNLHVEPDMEMVSDLDEVARAFKRVEIVDRATDEKWDTAMLADFVEEKIHDVRSLLVILNTRSVVKRLYRYLKGKGGSIPIYHLSTSMCAAHRTSILDAVRGHLDKEEPVLCISTQLIEAGVDISFDGVIRSLAGLDSIAQAAGRCNRHGKNGVQQVFVIDHIEEKLDKLKEIEVGKAESRNILSYMKRDPESFGGNLLSASAIKRYFQAFYADFETSLNYAVSGLDISMTELLTVEKQNSELVRSYTANKQAKLPLFIAQSYRTAAEHFNVIEDNAVSVIVPYGYGKELIATLNGGETIAELSRELKRAQHYSIGLLPYERDILSRNGGLVPLLDGKVFALRESAYSDEFGLNLDNDSEFELGFI